MRCSDCLAEMSAGPKGLYCETCGTEFQAVSEDGDVVMSTTPLRERAITKVMVAVVTMAVLGGAVAYGFGAFSPAGSDAAPKAGLDYQVERAESLLVSDPLELVQLESAVPANIDVPKLIAAQACQRVPKTPVEIEWLSPRGARLSNLRPMLPDNWHVREVCALPDNGAIVSARLPDGLAISQINANGSTDWSRIMPLERANTDAVSTLIAEDIVLIVSPTSDEDAHFLTAYDFKGEQVWQRLFPEVQVETSPILATNALADIFLAHRTSDESGVESTRVTALTPQNTVTYSVDLSEYAVLTRGTASDDIGQVLLIEERGGFSAQLLSASGTPIWHRSVDSGAAFIGVIFVGDQFFVAGYRDRTLMFWGLRDTGALSNAVELALNTVPTNGTLHALSDNEASLEILNETGDENRLILDLDRLSKALVFDDIDPGAFLNRDGGLATAEADAAPPSNLLSQPAAQRDDAPSSESVIETERPETASSNAPVLPEPLPERSGDDPVAAAPLTTAPIDASASVDSSSSEPARAELTEVQCVFTCAAVGNPGATYPIMQTVPLLEDEVPEAVPERLTETQAELCQLSGGQPAPESSPECTAR